MPVTFIGACDISVAGGRDPCLMEITFVIGIARQKKKNIYIYNNKTCSLIECDTNYCQRKKELDSS